MKKYLLYLLLLLPLLSCDKEADFRTSELQAPVVTGFQLIDENRQQGPTIGKPNDKAFSDPKLRMDVYPTPANYAINVNLKADGTQAAKVWLVQARTATSLSAYPAFFNTNAVVISGSPIASIKVVVNGDTHLSFALQELPERELPEGAYRLYVQIGDQLAWQNIWIKR